MSSIRMIVLCVMYCMCMRAADGERIHTAVHANQKKARQLLNDARKAEQGGTLTLEGLWHLHEQVIQAKKCTQKFAKSQKTADKEPKKK